MHAALSELDNLIRRKLDPNQIELSEGITNLKTEIPQHVRSTLESIRKFSLDAVDQLVDKDATYRFVTHVATNCVHHFQILEIYSKLGEKVFTHKAKTVYRAIHSSVCKDLDGFISFLQFQFRPYFDLDLPVPYTRVEKAQVSFKNRIEALNPLREFLGEFEQLLDVCLMPIQTLITRGGTVTFRQMEYHLVLLDRLEKLLENPPVDTNLALHQTLVSINYNNQDYIQYCIRQLHSKYADLTLLQQLEKYNWYIKAQRQVEKDPVLVFQPGNASAFDQLNNYLIHEIEYIQTLIKLDAGYIDGVKVSENGHHKLRLNMSVDVAAAWLNCLWDTHTILAQSKEEAIEAFVKVCSTVGTDNVSFKSLRSKFFSLSQNSVSQVMDLLHKQREASRTYMK
ncbi:hypothetical protein HB364_13735 [Pseudoflavitalea sp. X16]|uniref:hypothetical protein n=1 Tax=Paraflavitalea devenefica TaxID=2716334 RepID=UPI00141F35DC|nr:hypothetical protein [Paraflavitalea devenefica]NII26149.1 hypothetical protein [Paraflavitalea devenefica]